MFHILIRPLWIPALFQSVMLLTLKEDTTTGKFYLCHLFYMLSVLIISNYICTRLHLYKITRYTDDTIVGMGLHLPFIAICHVIGWVYFIHDMCICGY